MGLLKYLSVLSPLQINVFGILAGGRHIGTDRLGNKYYRARPRAGYKRERRWVIYNGEPEASKVPPEWHGWLHYQTDTIPESGTPSFRRPWQKGHLPNQTGLVSAYRPPGHVLEGGKRDKATGDYEAWRPSDQP